MSNLILTSYTGEYTSGGVPRWVRDFKKCFPEAKSYSWQDVIDEVGCGTNIIKDEWTKADVLNHWLISTGRRTKDDIIIGDGWWAGKFFPDRTISICHGIWSHLIKEEADAGVPPDMPFHHFHQVNYRKNTNCRLVAVSEFIQYQMEVQFGFKSEVINNAIDLDKFKPIKIPNWDDKKLIIHGINDKGNNNKGWDHIDHILNYLDIDVTKYGSVEILSLDEAYENISQGDFTKYEVLAMANLVVIPSGYEGNSYFALEAMACGVPVIAYDVGLFWELSQNGVKEPGKLKFGGYSSGIIMNRQERRKETTCKAVQWFLEADDIIKKRMLINPRAIAERYSIERFHQDWRTYLKKEFDYHV